MFKKTALAAMVALTLAPAAATAMSMQILLPDVSFPKTQTEQSTKGK